MSEPLESLYPQIGQIIANAITEDWSSARISVEIKPGVVTIQGHYIPIDGNAERSLRIPRELVTLFSDLHFRMVEEKHDDWKNVIFELMKSGKFSMKFEY